MPARSSDSSRPVALIDGEPVTWAELQPGLAEVAGRTVLEEAILDRRLGQEPALAGLSLPPDAAATERDLLIRSLQRGVGGQPPAAANADEVSLAIARLRRDRALGDSRFAGLLRRSAALRLLVQPSVRVSEEAIVQAYAIKYGEKRRCRIIVVPTQRQAADVLASLATEGTPADLPGRFAQLAREVSTDLSRRAASPDEAGLIEAFSVEDPSYPTVMREAAGKLEVGGLSPVLAFDPRGDRTESRARSTGTGGGGFAILLLDAIIPPALPEPAPSHAIRDELEADLRLRMERLQMDRKAAELLARPGVSILDRGLDWSWQNEAR